MYRYYVEIISTNHVYKGNPIKIISKSITNSIPNLTYIIPSTPPRLQTLQIQGFGAFQGSKPYKYNGLMRSKAQNLTNTTVWGLPRLQTLQIQWFGALQGSKPYKYNGLGPSKAPNLANTMVWGPPNLKTWLNKWKPIKMIQKPTKPTENQCLRAQNQLNQQKTNVWEPKTN